jgi:hydroxyethylthiazole kinase-like uncharacterized protein yjeF
MRVMGSGYVGAYGVDEIRNAEAPILARVREGTLMRRAAARLAVVCARVLKEGSGRVSGRRVALLVGPGNNGGDALLAGAWLRKRGVAVQAILTDGVAYEPGLRDFRARGGYVLGADVPNFRNRASEVLKKAHLIVDGVIGIGGSGGLRGVTADLVTEISNNVPVVAVDLPSGVNPDTGETDGPHVHADVTVTFGAVKPCLLLPPACHYVGKVEFVDVGIGSQLSGEPIVRRLTPVGAAAQWPTPRREDHKYTRGVLGVVAGSNMYPGAAVLACAGAVRAGAGIVRYVGPGEVTNQVLAARPEVVRGFGQVQAWLLGSGVEADDKQSTAIERALGSGLPCLVDAGALEACVRDRVRGFKAARAESVLLTPHAGELARMLSLLGYEVGREVVEARPLYHARWIASESDATVLLKGYTTLVVDPEGKVSSQEDGSAWLATAGSGDVLAGIAGALMSAGLSAMDAGSMAALVHGRAAVRASNGGPIAAMDIAEATPATISELLQLKEG